MKQMRLLLFTSMFLALSGCAAGLIYDQDRKPRDCGEIPDQRCLNAVDVDDGSYRVSVNSVPGV